MPLRFGEVFFYGLTFLFWGYRINDGGNFAHRVGRKTALFGVLPNHFFVVCIVDAIDFVTSYIAVNSLDFWSHFAQYSTRSFNCFRSSLPAPRISLSITYFVISFQIYFPALMVFRLCPVFLRGRWFLLFSSYFRIKCLKIK